MLCDPQNAINYTIARFACGTTRTQTTLSTDWKISEKSQAGWWQRIISWYTKENGDMPEDVAADLL